MLFASFLILLVSASSCSNGSTELISLLAKGCIDDGAIVNPTDNADCILAAIDALDSAGGGRLLVDGFFATSKAVPIRSKVRYLPAKPGVSGFIAHPSSTDNVLGEATPPTIRLPIIKPYLGMGLVVDGNSANVDYNTHGAGGATDDAYQNCVRLYEVNGLEAPFLIVRNCTMNGYSDYFYGQDNHVGRLVATNIGKSTNIPVTSPVGAASYNAAWIEFNTIRSTIDYLDVNGARDRGYRVTTGYASAYADAIQVSPSVLGGHIRNVGVDGMTAEIVGGAYGEIRDLRWLNIIIDGPQTGMGEGARLAAAGNFDNSAIVNPQIRLSIRNSSQHGIVAYNRVINAKIEGQFLGNTGVGVVLGPGVINATLVNLVSSDNKGGNLIDQGIRTSRGASVVTK